MSVWRTAAGVDWWVFMLDGFVSEVNIRTDYIPARIALFMV